LYVSDGQTTAIAPQGIRDSGTVSVQVEYKGVASQPVSLPVLPVRPGIFTVNRSGTNQAVIINSDGSLNSTSNPAQRGSVVSLYATGGGLAAPSVADDQLRDDSPSKLLAPHVLLTYTMDFEEYASDDALSAGEVAGSVEGLIKIVAQLPDFLYTGTN